MNRQHLRIGIALITMVITSAQSEAQVVVGGNFDPAQVTADIAAEICAIVERAEAADPDSDMVVGSARGLSYGMKTHY